MEQNIKLINFVEILRQGFSLNNVYFLASIKNGEEPWKLLDFPVGQSIVQGMVRKGLITSRNEITPIGEKLLKLAYEEILVDRSVETIERIDKVSRKDRETIFNDWWTQYPGTDTFEYRNKKFAGTRALRVKKEECKPVFEKILREGFSLEEMIGATHYEVLQKKEASFISGENKLKFMQNSLTYLRQRTWEPFIELIREGHKAETSSYKGGGSPQNMTTDI